MFRSWQPMFTICLHCTENSTLAPSSTGWSHMGFGATWRKVNDRLIYSKWKTWASEAEESTEELNSLQGWIASTFLVISAQRYATAPKNRGFQMPPSYLWGGRTNPSIVPGLKWETSSFNALPLERPHKSLLLNEVWSPQIYSALGDIGKQSPPTPSDTRTDSNGFIEYKCHHNYH